MTNRDNVNLLKSIVRNPFAWPGGYERFAVTTDGAAICFKCCASEYAILLRSTRGRDNDGWTVEAASSDCEMDGPLSCDHCSREIIEDWQDDMLEIYPDSTPTN